MLNWLSWSGLWLVFSAFCLLWSRFGASLASVSAVIIPPLSSLWPLRSVALGFALCLQAKRVRGSVVRICEAHRFLVRFRRYGEEFFFKSSLCKRKLLDVSRSCQCDIQKWIRKREQQCKRRGWERLALTGVEFVNELLGSALCRLHVRHNLLICKLVLFDTECPDGGYILLLFGGEGCSSP